DCAKLSHRDSRSVASAGVLDPIRHDEALRCALSAAPRSLVRSQTPGRCHELVIGCTASVEVAVFLDQLERGSRPVLASRLNHVEMCEQEDRLAASVIGSGILETAIRLQLVSATVRRLSRGELAGRAFKTLDHDEASDFASEEGVQELG